MLILGIESSCDETGVALYDSKQGLLAHGLHSQMDMHSAYGGVVPELASRDHIRRLLPLIRQVLTQAEKDVAALDCIAYTQGPGLGGALLAGVSVAAGLGLVLKKPLLGIHHLEGHLLSPMLDGQRPSFPFVALLVSGGHTQLMLVEAVGIYRMLGETVDDAAGEAFDKAASLLGLGYPGGPALAQLATAGDPARFKLPRPMIGSADLDFSFSGLKTALQTLVRRYSPDELPKADVAAGFQEAIAEVLVKKCQAALEKTQVQTLVVAGGVGANLRLRALLQKAAQIRGTRLIFPPLALCTDNGAMIAFAAALRLEGRLANLQTARSGFRIHPRWSLEHHQFAA